MLLFGSLAQGLGDWNDQWSRVSWTGIGCGLILACLAPNPFATILIALISLGVIWHQPMSVVYRDKVAPGLVLIAAYVIAAPLMRPWMVPVLLGGITVVGALTGAWAIYSSFQPKDQPYQHTFLKGWLVLADRDGGAPLASQGNFNHAQSVGALAVASNLGLLLLGHFWTLPLLVLCILAVILSTEGRMTGKWLCQGWVHLFWVMIATIAIIVNSWVSWMILGGIAIALLIWAHPWNPRTNWYDSHRFETWNFALREIWWRAAQPKDPRQALALAQQERVMMEDAQAKAAAEGNALIHNQITLAKLQNDKQQREWTVLAKQQQGEALTEAEQAWAWRLWAQRLRVRLLGCGTGTWYPLTKWPALMRTGKLNETTKVWEGMVYLSAHNEYVELWFEQGLIGLLAALGFVAYGLQVTWTGGPVGLAVFLPVVALLSIAFTNFPFTLFREVDKANPAQATQFVGCPALVVMSLVVLLLVEAVR